MMFDVTVNSIRDVFHLMHRVPAIPDQAIETIDLNLEDETYSISNLQMILDEVDHMRATDVIKDYGDEYDKEHIEEVSRDYVRLEEILESNSVSYQCLGLIHGEVWYIGAY